MKRESQRTPFRFTLTEFSGSLGDLGTFLPLVIAMVIAMESRGESLDIGVVLFFAGLMNVLTGVIFRQPIPVQPMKAIAAVAIADGLSAGELAASGLAIGFILIALALTGAIETVIRWVPKSVVRGIQLGVGLKIAQKGAVMLSELDNFGWDSRFAAVILALVLTAMMWKRLPGLLVIFAAGFVILFFSTKNIYSNLTYDWPNFRLIIPSFAEFQGGFFKGTIPQLPLTLLNSVVAVCALSGDYFPNKGIGPKRMAISVGLMNIIAVPLGAMPMCHGSGGLAAQYEFGARTGGSVIMLGIIKMIIGLLLGAAILQLLRSYPDSIVGIMLVVAGIGLAKAARDCLTGEPFFIVFMTTIFALGHNTAVGFLAGMLTYLALKLRHRILPE